MTNTKAGDLSVGDVAWGLSDARGRFGVGNKMVSLSNIKSSKRPANWERSMDIRYELLDAPLTQLAAGYSSVPPFPLHLSLRQSQAKVPPAVSNPAVPSSFPLHQARARQGGPATPSATLPNSLASTPLSTPSTCVPFRPDFLEVAQQLNGSDFNQDGKPDYALCMQTSAGCIDEVFSLGMIATGLLQTQARDERRCLNPEHTAITGDVLGL